MPETKPENALPHALEAEQAVVGGLLQDSAHFDAIIEQVTDKDFYLAGHKHIF